MATLDPRSTAPFLLGDGPTGVVMCHGFTGSPGSLREWSEALTKRLDVTVMAPRLTGHGTRLKQLDTARYEDWVADVEAAYLTLSGRCERVFVAGLSMGGALALWLAEHHDPAGVLLVNPAIASRDPLLPYAKWLRHLMRRATSVASDIAKPGVREPAYERVSVPAAYQMTRLWDDVRAHLQQITAPALLMTSTTDHVVDASSAEILRRELPDVRHVELTRSYHVATMDYDLDVIVAESERFIAAAS